MPQRKSAKGEKAAKVKDLPVRSVKAKDAAKVKGGNPDIVPLGGQIATPFIPGGAVLTAAISNVGSLKSSSGA